MTEKMIENNKVSVIGEIVSDFTFSHEVFGEGFYMVELSVNRLSEQADIIPLMVSERLVDVHKDYKGCTMEAVGQFRSYNRHEGTKNRLMLSVFVREIHFMDEFTDYTKTNQIFLDGYICKAPIYRKTPLGREIADLLLAVNRPMENQIISLVSAGAVMPVLLLALRLEQGSVSGEESRAGSIQRRSRRQNVRSVLLMKYPSASWSVMNFK